MNWKTIPISQIWSSRQLRCSTGSSMQGEICSAYWNFVWLFNTSDTFWQTEGSLRWLRSTRLATLVTVQESTVRTRFKLQQSQNWKNAFHTYLNPNCAANDAHRALWCPGWGDGQALLSKVHGCLHTQVLQVILKGKKWAYVNFDQTPPHWWRLLWYRLPSHALHGAPWVQVIFSIWLIIGICIWQLFLLQAKEASQPVCPSPVRVQDPPPGLPDPAAGCGQLQGEISQIPTIEKNCLQTIFLQTHETKPGRR